jgi:biotin operon repressor
VVTRILKDFHQLMYLCRPIVMYLQHIFSLVKEFRKVSARYVCKPSFCINIILIIRGWGYIASAFNVASKEVRMHSVEKLNQTTPRMQFEKQLNKLTFLHTLLEQQATGTAAQVADRLGVSRRTLFVYLEFLKEKGAPIDYCRKRRTYFYTIRWELNLI